MVNLAPVIVMIHDLGQMIATCLGIILGAAIGLPIKRTIIRNFKRPAS
jgi:hypothetical protein